MINNNKSIALKKKLYYKLDISMCGFAIAKRASADEAWPLRGLAMTSLYEE